MSSSRQTMLRVAELAQVSIATVSRVINTPELVAPETRERVMQVMHQINYSYNALAGGLSRQHTMTIGLILPAITNPIFAESTKGVQDLAATHGYALLTGITDYQASEEARLMRVFRQHRVDGMIITSSALDSPALLELQQAGLPLVLTYSSRLRAPIPLIGVDNQAAAAAAVGYLVRLGHQRIGMLAGKFSGSDRSYARYCGYAAALQAHNLAVDPALVVEVEYGFTEGGQGLLQLLALPQPPTAIFCSNDILAFGALRAALDAGLEIPRDLSLIGFDDSPMAAMSNPRLTTVSQPAYMMGRSACEVLLALMRGEEPSSRTLILPTELRLRETTAPPLFR